MNWIPEINPVPVVGKGTGVTDKNERCALIRRPGLKLFTTLPLTPMRGVFPGENRMFAVAGSHFFEVFADGTYIDRSIAGFSGSSGIAPAGGPIGNDGNPVQFFANGNQVLLISAGQAYCDNGNGPVPCQFSDQLTDLLIDPNDATGETLTTPTGGIFDQSDVGRTIQITGGAGFILQSQVIASVNGTGEALAAASWGVPGSGLGTGVEWLGYVSYSGTLSLVIGTILADSARAFGPSDIGAKITITGGTGFTPGTYTIIGLVYGPDGTPNGDAILNIAAGSTGASGGSGTEAAMLVTASQGAFLDGYGFAAPSPATKTVYFSAIDDFTSWDPLDFFVKQNYPDNVASLYADHEELYVAGDLQSIQVYRDVGDALNPFAPDPGAVITLCCQAPFSFTRLGNGVGWLGGDVTRGERHAYLAVGYQPQVISTPAVEAQWAKYVTIGDAIGWNYANQGHELWVVCFPSANATWVYDLTTGWWHEWGWWNGASWDRFRGQYHAVVYLYGSTVGEQHFVGDWQTGQIYTMSFSYLDDNGTTIYRMRRCPQLTEENKRRFYAFFQIDCDVSGLQRVYWNRLTYGRDRIWQLMSWQPTGDGVTLELQYSDTAGQSFVTVSTTQTLDPSVDVQLCNAYLMYTDGKS